MVGKYQGMLVLDSSTYSYIFFIGLFLVGCANIKAMYLAKCRYVDDWFLSRLAYEFQDQLLFLDLSECSSIGVTGILALCRLKYVFIYFSIVFLINIYFFLLDH
jgi:hypothetical protein